MSLIDGDNMPHNLVDKVTNLRSSLFDGLSEYGIILTLTNHSFNNSV